MKVLDFIIPRDIMDTNTFMGHVEDTDHVRKMEVQYRTSLVGYSAKWRVVGDVYRIQIWKDGRWQGTYSLFRDDLCVYNKGQE
jgi:hypothetical protein